MNNEILSALLLGLIGGLIPGPVLVVVFTEILQLGIWKSFRIIFLAMFIESTVALISLIVFTSMNFSESFFRSLSMIGAIILIWISTSIWKIKKLDIKEKVNFNFVKILTMIMTNGILWTFWITVCVPKAVLLNETIIFGKYLFLIFVEMGWFISTISVAFIFLRFRKILSDPKIVPIIFKIFALIFVYFAIDMVYKSIVFFLI